MFSQLKLKTRTKSSRHWFTGWIKAAAEKHFWQLVTCESAGLASVAPQTGAATIAECNISTAFHPLSSLWAMLLKSCLLLTFAHAWLIHHVVFFKEYINILQVQWMSESKSIPSKCTGVAVVLTEPLQLCMRWDESTGRILAMTSCPWLATRRSQQMVHHQSSIQETNLARFVIFMLLFLDHIIHFKFAVFIVYLQCSQSAKTTLFLSLEHLHHCLCRLFS